MRLGQFLLASAAEIRLAVEMTRIYDGEKLVLEQLEDILNACISITKSEFKTPKLSELCGQFFLAKNFFADADDALTWAWLHGTSETLASTAAVLITLHKREGDFDRLRQFGESEVIPALGEVESALAQEACARVYIAQRESAKAIPFLRRCLSLDPFRPWVLKEASIAALDIELLSEARHWRGRLAKQYPNHLFLDEVNRALADW